MVRGYTDRHFLLEIGHPLDDLRPCMLGRVETTEGQAIGGSFYSADGHGLKHVL